MPTRRKPRNKPSAANGPAAAYRLSAARRRAFGASASFASDALPWAIEGSSDESPSGNSCGYAEPLPAYARPKAFIAEDRPPRSVVRWSYLIALGGILITVALGVTLWLFPFGFADAAPTGNTQRQAVSTPTEQWYVGTLPILYQTDGPWADIPYGVTSISQSGSAPTALAMVHADLTGQRDITPADFAGWAETAMITAPLDSNYRRLLTEGAAAFDLQAQPVDLDAMDLRRALVRGNPVICIVGAGVFGRTPTCLVLASIDEQSRLVLVDTDSAENTARPWSFDEVLAEATAAYAYTV